MKKKSKIIIAVIAVLALAATAAICYRNNQIYHATYLVIDEVEYRRDSTSLDLSGSTIGEFDKLKELTALESLNLRDTGITIEQYEDLQAALPECEILWSVPFQDGYVDNDVTELNLVALSEADLDILPYLTELRAVSAPNCRKYDELIELNRRYPDIDLSYNVEIGGKIYEGTSETIDIANPDTDEVAEKLSFMPHVQTVNLNGDLPENDKLLKLQQAYPEITFVFDFTVFGIPVNTMDEFIDLSGIQVGSTEAVDAIIPHFYNLSQIDMVGCGISNDSMDALNKRYPDIKIVWRVNACGIWLRTDALYFMPVQYKVSSATGAQCYNLRYCTDMQVVDLGRYGTNDLSFVEHMPNLKYLLVCEGTVSDMTPVGNCISLEYIELQMSNAADLWPLTNLTNLRDLNLAEIPWEDMTPLLQMTWLDRLWFSKNGLSYASQEMMREALPNTVLIFYSSGHTTSGFRYTPRYFEQRDILGMYYGVN